MKKRPFKTTTMPATTGKSLRRATKQLALVAVSALAFGLFATACKNDNPVPPPAPQSNETGIVASFSASTPAVYSSDLSGPTAPQASLAEPQTKTANIFTLAQEQRVFNVWIVQFDKGTGQRVGLAVYKEITAAQQIDNLISNLTFKLTAVASPQVLYFVANTNNETFFDDSNSTTLSALTATIQTLASEFKPTTAEGLPMLGSLEIPALTADMDLGTIHLQRLVAKIVFRYKNSFPNFTVTDIQLRNVAASFTYTSQPTGSVNYPAKTASSHFDYLVEAPVAAGGDGYSVMTWYVPENLRKAAVANSTLPMGDRNLAATEDQMATYIELIGLFVNTTRAERVVYQILIGDVSDATNGNSDFNVRRNNIYTISATLLNSNAADHRITVIPFLSVQPITTANSYMFAPGGGVIFPAKIKGNESAETLATQSAALLWQDAPGMVKSTNYDSSTGKILVTTDATKGSGNALIAAYDGPNGTGNILWSWHIWVTSYQPSEAGVAVRTANTAYTVTGGQVHTYGTNFQTINGTSRTIMDRNLGAKRTYYNTSPATGAEASEAYGYHYQWGRKDPFSPAIGVYLTTTAITLYNAAGTSIPAAQAPILVSGQASVASAISTPTTFYYNSSSNWLTPADNNLWVPGSKTIYDPCPKGWRIPIDGTFGDFTSGATGTFLWYNNGTATTSTGTAGAENGRRYTAGGVTSWYPVASPRANNTGLFYNLGNSGSIWLAYGSGGNAGKYLSFSTWMLNPTAGMVPTYGASIRCIQE